MHTYYSGLAACPWCGLENTTGILLFLSSDSISRIDVGTEWQKVPAVKPPGPIPVISPRKYHCAPAPLPSGVARMASFRKFGKILAIIFLVASVLLLFLWSEWDLLKILASIVPAVIGALILVIPGKDTAEKKRRKKVFEDAKYSWKLWEKKWIAEAGDAGFTSQVNALNTLRAQYEAIEKDYQKALDDLQNTTKERQQKKFLENCYIENCTSPRLGENRKAALRSFGIETAADIDMHTIMGIPGFDTAIANELVAWRKRQEQLFVYDDKKGVSPSDVQNLIHTFQPRIRPVEREFLLGVENLHAIQQKILRNRAKFQPVIEKSARDLAQAEANFSVFTLTGSRF
jgi:DNA-binding helix-hairpin-helix protein with protein kinase domain